MKQERNTDNEMQSDDSDSLLLQIEAFIKDNERGVSIQAVAENFGMSRYNTIYYLGMLVGAGKVGVAQMGPVKVHYYKGDPNPNLNKEKTK